MSQSIPKADESLIEKLKLVPLSTDAWQQVLLLATPLLVCKIQLLSSDASTNSEWVKHLQRDTRGPDLHEILTRAQAYEKSSAISYHHVDEETFLASQLVVVDMQTSSQSLYLISALCWDHMDNMFWRLYEITTECRLAQDNSISFIDFTKQVVAYRARYNAGDLSQDVSLDDPKEFWGSDCSSTDIHSHAVAELTGAQLRCTGNMPQTAPALSGQVKHDQYRENGSLSSTSVLKHVRESLCSLLALWRAADLEDADFIDLTQHLTR